jgi:hypothetical protein
MSGARSYIVSDTGEKARQREQADAAMAARFDDGHRKALFDARQAVKALIEEYPQLRDTNAATLRLSGALSGAEGNVRRLREDAARLERQGVDLRVEANCGSIEADQKAAEVARELATVRVSIEQEQAAIPILRERELASYLGVLEAGLALRQAAIEAHRAEEGARVAEIREHQREIKRLDALNVSGRPAAFAALAAQSALSDVVDAVKRITPAEK